ncbi:hypothetical protein JRO89_XS02G0252400 [Xanthoceras sorbifolium]|uniref:BED-type domain-containing protein n=1 Tax=Xanthoceras sorbifolium TaxID=99658 RepID=A0ABQ8IHE8_9ROSI|nr:hypothetical protein JRO89_XS02G0252400 [Xanthoceras sorbifolium]
MQLGGAAIAPELTSLSAPLIMLLLVHKMPTRKDPAWKYGVEVETEWTTQHIRCNFCENIIKGGVTRMRQHLSGDHPTFPACTMVPAEVRDEIKRYNERRNNYIRQIQIDNFASSQTKGGSSLDSVSQRGIRRPMDRFVTNIEGDETELRGNNKQEIENEARDRTCMDIGRFFFENGIAFNIANSPSFINMCRSIGNYGPGLKPPSPYELSTTILKEEESNTKAIVAEVKKT